MSSSGPSLPPQNPTRQRIWLGENDPNRSPRQQLLRLLKGGFVALAGGYMLGFASYFLDRAGYLSGIARRADVIIARRGLTAEVPGRLERYEWTARLIPEKEYHGGERVVAWPELVISYTADDGHTRWIRVRGQPDNTDTIPTYMAHFAGIFGLPWIDYVLDPDVMRRLRYDPRRPPGWSNQPPLSLSEEERARAGDTYDTSLVASATDNPVEQLALMWAAPAPSMRVRYDPRNPARAWPVPLLDALSRPLSDDVAALIEAGVLAILGAAVLWRVLVFVLRLRRAVVAAIWAVAVLSAPLWTAHVEMVADVLGVSRVMSTMVGRGLTNPVKLHRIEVEPVDQPGPSRAVRWSLGPSEGADLLARLAPPSPHLSWSDLLAREPSLGGAQGSGVAARFAQAVSASLLALPDEQLRDLLAGMCEPGRRGGITYMLRPALERLAADASRAADIRVQAKALANHAAICR